MGRKRQIEAADGALNCTVHRDITIKLLGGRIVIKCPDKEISIVDDTECVKVLSNKRLWVKAVAAVAGVQLDAGDDDSAASGYTTYSQTALA